MAALPFIAACVGRESIPATELPSLAKSIQRFPQGYHYTRRTDGRQVTLTGAVRRVDIIGQSGSVETIAPPFQALESNDKSKLLLRRPHEAPREYRLESIKEVQVTYSDNPSRDYAIGIPLLAGSVPFIVMSMFFLTNPREYAYYDRLGYLLGGVMMAGGLGMAIPGLIFTARPKLDPSIEERSSVLVSGIAVDVPGRSSKPISPTQRFVSVGPLGISGAF
jgi:hypothetical protein